MDAPQAHPETGLGGRLLYAGELDEAARALLVSANIAGAATLAATADRTAQKQALRDGVADFVVSNLDEALRILKNQLRKRETVAVCVALPPSEVGREMNERGVAPDLLSCNLAAPPLYQANPIHEHREMAFDLTKIAAIVTWRVDSALPKDLAALDEIALTCLDAHEWQSRRWLRLSPRYLGRLAQGLRLLRTDHEFVARFRERARGAIDCGRIAVAFEICSYVHGMPDQFRFDPSQR